MILKYNYWTAITISVSLLLFLYFPSFAQYSSNSQHSSEIIFTKSSQTLGNTLTFGFKIKDVDLDSDNDIFIANYSDVSASRLWINDGSGHFTLHNQYFGNGAPAAHDVDIADLNGDSYPDIFLVNHNAANQIYFGNVNGNYYESSQAIGIEGDSPQTIQLIDVDGDGDQDAYIYNISAPNRIWLNDGNGYFTMRNIDYGGSNSNIQVLTDFNNDSFPDLFISMRTEPAQIWMNDGAGNFTNTGQALAGGGVAIDCEDIDNDGDIDIVAINYSSGTIWLNQNNTGFFVAGFTFDEGALRCKLFDVDLDGDYDLVTAPLDGGSKLWLNDGSGSFTFYSSILYNTRIFSVECKDLDGDNDFDLVFGQEPNTGGNSIYFNETGIVNIDEKANIQVKHFKLQNNYPNPFNPCTKIRYSIPQKGFITLTVYNVNGELISKLVNNEMLAGEYEVEFDGTELSSGVYFYQLIIGDQAEMKKMILLK